MVTIEKYYATGNDFRSNLIVNKDGNNYSFTFCGNEIHLKITTQSREEFEIIVKALYNSGNAILEMQEE